MPTDSIVLGIRSGSLFRPTYRVNARIQLYHLALFGPTGSGKSTQMLSLATQDSALHSRPGFLLVDLKDTLAYDAAKLLPPFRERDALLFDAADRTFPPAFNPLANVPEESRTLAASELVSAFKRLWGESWGPRIEHVLRNAALTLLETPNATLLDIRRLLTNEVYRAFATQHLTNGFVRQFWQQEFPAIVGTRGSVANVESILNKLSILSSYKEVSNILGQTTKGLDIGAAMNEGKIVLAHLPQGVLGEDASTFLASLLVTHTQLAAQRRVTLSQGSRKPFYLFADEFQNYDTSSFNKLITEGRSMAVGVIAACQFEEQLPTQLRQTINHNCALKLFCGTERGQHIVEVVYPQQPRPQVPLILQALLPPNRSNPEQLEYIRARSRRILARPRGIVEAEISERMDIHQEEHRGQQSRYYET